MKPILISGDESCYCGKRDWVREAREGGVAIVCYECRYQLGIVLDTPSTDE